MLRVLVLADAITHTEKFNPRFMIDLATLTGAIIVSKVLSMQDFFNNDKLSKELINSGNKVYRNFGECHQ